MHQLSVTGDTELVTSSVELPMNIKAKKGRQTVTFSTDDAAEFEKLKEKLVLPITNIIKTKYKDALLESELSPARHTLSHSEFSALLSDVKTRVAKNEHYIKERLREFLSESDTISIEGFVNFRLRDYRDEIRRCADSAISSLMVQREYDEFTQLLKYYASTVQPLYSVLHIIVTKCGGYVICDEDNNDITRTCADEIAELFMADEIGFDDILLSVLLTCAPEKIVFHCVKYIKTPRLVETIKIIFGGSVFFCDGCPLCRFHADN